MKKLKILYVDDQVLQHQYMDTLFSETGLDLDIHYFQGHRDLLFNLDDHLDANVIFLDVEMPEIDGLSLAKQIRKSLPEIPLVFVTAYAQYAIKGYEVSALDYLLKPVELEEIKRVLNRISNLRQDIEQFIILESQKVAIDEIYYIEAQGHLCLIRFENAMVEVRESLFKLANQLNDDFVQCHRAFWVNINHIYQVNKESLVLENNDCIPLSRRMAKNVLDKFVNHYRKQEYSL